MENKDEIIEKENRECPANQKRSLLLRVPDCNAFSRPRLDSRERGFGGLGVGLGRGFAGVCVYPFPQHSRKHTRLRHAPNGLFIAS